MLRAKGADVRYHAPYAPAIRHNGCEPAGETDLDAALRLSSGQGSPLPVVGDSLWSQDRLLAAADGAVVVTDHSCYD